MAFADKGSAAANLPSSNFLKGSFKFPLGDKAPSTNRVVGKFRSAVDDFALTTLAVNDKIHQKKVKKVHTQEINLAAVDNFHQARRLLNQQLAEWRDGDVFVSGESDGEALLLEEGDVVAITDDSGRYRNATYRIEDLTIKNSSGYPSVAFVARKYRRFFYDDQVTERLVPLPIIQNTAVNTERDAAVIFQDGAATNTFVSVGVTNYTTAASFRKVQVALNNTFSSGLSEFIHSAQNEVGLILTDHLFLARSTNLSTAETKYVRVAHSTNGETFGLWSNILPITYTTPGGDGGTPPQSFPPSGGGIGTDGGFQPGHKVDPFDLDL
jgi:hypothetical protein